MNGALGYIQSIILFRSLNDRDVKDLGGIFKGQLVVPLSVTITHKYQIYIIYDYIWLILAFPIGIPNGRGACNYPLRVSNCS